MSASCMSVCVSVSAERIRRQMPWALTRWCVCAHESCYRLLLKTGLSPDHLDEDGELHKLSGETEGLRVVYTDVRLDNYLNRAGNRVYVPPPVAHRGLLWWRAQLAHYLLRPNSYVSALFQRELQALEWPTHNGATRLPPMSLAHGPCACVEARAPRPRADRCGPERQSALPCHSRAASFCSHRAVKACAPLYVRTCL